jgi:hypothetical protein
MSSSDSDGKRDAKQSSAPDVSSIVPAAGCKKPRKARAPNKYVGDCPEDFTCIFKGCLVKSANERQWNRHIRSLTHEAEFANLPVVAPGQAKRKPNKAGLMRPASGKCQFCDDVFPDQKNWYNHVKTHGEYDGLAIKIRPAKRARLGPEAPGDAADIHDMQDAAGLGGAQPHVAVAVSAPGYVAAVGYVAAPYALVDGDDAEESVVVTEHAAAPSLDDAEDVTVVERAATLSAQKDDSDADIVVLTTGAPCAGRGAREYPAPDENFSCPYPGACFGRFHATEHLRQQHIRQYHREKYDKLLPKVAAARGVRGPGGWLVWPEAVEDGNAGGARCPECNKRSTAWHSPGLGSTNAFKEHIRSRHSLSSLESAKKGAVTVATSSTVPVVSAAALVVVPASSPIATVTVPTTTLVTPACAVSAMAAQCAPPPAVAAVAALAPLQCWLCSVTWVNHPLSGDLYLDHVNTVHHLNLSQQCKWCPATFLSSDARIHGTHAAECTRSQNKTEISRHAKCGLCGELHTSRPRLLRHYNNAHAAQFPCWIALFCPSCKSTNMNSHDALVRHRSLH